MSFGNKVSGSDFDADFRFGKMDFFKVLADMFQGFERRKNKLPAGDVMVQ
jgi:hypothetical protein